MLPVITSTVAVIPMLFMGSLIMENFFGIPGLGSYTIDAINAQDFSVVRAMVFLERPPIFCSFSRTWPTRWLTPEYG